MDISDGETKTKATAATESP